MAAKTIGLLGGGQLGRMIAQEGKRLGFRYVCWDPAPDCPAAVFCDEAFTAPFEDSSTLSRFIKKSDIVTFEWENIPAELVKRIEGARPVHPSSRVLEVVQDRLVQREFLKKSELPQTAYRGVSGLAALTSAAKELGYPAILKTRRLGYDGKGQFRLSSSKDFPSASALLGKSFVLEAFVPFIKEISVILARTEDGRTAVYPVAENVHRNGILHTTRAPADISPETAQEATELARQTAKALDHVGVMAVEFFVLADGRLLINEVAPRVHNSGHYTLGACATSQFEQHTRAIAGLPLGETTQSRPAVMLNLLGDLWARGEPDWKSALPEGAALHLYGKKKALPGRKMGHVLFLGDPSRALASSEALLKQLI